MKTVKVAILGLGTVGSGVYKLIQKRADVMEKTIGAQMEVKKILVRNINKKREGVDASLLTDNWNDIVEDDEIQIVIEVMGGMEPAKTMILEALRAGKNVVSANKDLIAEEGHVLLATAEEHHVDFLFEAAVAGAIPIIRPMKQCLAVNDISEVVGIVNGTTNYILTKMTEEGMDFSDALEKAQELGFAEADPTSDVEGLDAGRKVAIMASIAFHSRVVFPNVFTEGITKITTEDMKYAKKMDMAIKLLASSKREGDSFSAIVAPMLLSKNHPLCNVNDVFNAVFVRGNMLGDAMFYGSGAGKLPTASAVVADVVDAAKHLHRTVVTRWESKTLELVPNADAKRRFFVRINGEESALKSHVDEVFGQVEVVKADDVKGEFAVITGEMTEAEYAQKAEEMPEVVKMIRMAD